MSTHTQAPDLSLTVRYSRGGKNNGGEKEESQVEIYEDVNTLGRSHIDLASRKVGKNKITKYYTKTMFFAYLIKS